MRQNRKAEMLLNNDEEARQQRSENEATQCKEWLMGAFATRKRGSDEGRLKLR